MPHHDVFLQGYSKMRTTMNIDDDVLNAVKEISRRQARPVGEVASKLLREALDGKDEEIREEPARDGFQPFAKSTDIVTNDMIEQLREEAGD
jgi:hypothetical protein